MSTARSPAQKDFPGSQLPEHFTSLFETSVSMMCAAVREAEFAPSATCYIQPLLLAYDRAREDSFFLLHFVPCLLVCFLRVLSGKDLQFVLEYVVCCVIRSDACHGLYAPLKPCFSSMESLPFCLALN